ncbi:MAG: hypothetical protein NWQ46_07790, partial [Spirosomaceae bacterium]|nr:hypothetical protein [Spirosomataceae bacterium]
MLLTIEGKYENGEVRFKETPKNIENNSDVLITFLPKPHTQNFGQRILGVWEGKYSIPEDFNEPL